MPTKPAVCKPTEPAVRKPPRCLPSNACCSFSQAPEVRQGHQLYVIRAPEGSAHRSSVMHGYAYCGRVPETPGKHCRAVGIAMYATMRVEKHVYIAVPAPGRSCRELGARPQSSTAMHCIAAG